MGKARSVPDVTDKPTVLGQELDDAALVFACRSGDADAWDVLVTRYERLIYTIARNAGLDVDLAADVYQCVFASLVEHLASIEHPARIRAWLITTARHEAWRVKRREQLAGQLFNSSEHAEALPDEALPPHDLVLRIEEQHRIQAAVAALDDRCRQLIILLFYKAKSPSYAEIAATLGMVESSVGPTRARCLQKLRHLLDRSET
jgi:RNA polymerase sigma factor (sigma-70 family)